MTRGPRRVRSWLGRGLVVLVGLCFAITGVPACSRARALVGPYTGPYPAPGAITAFDTVAWRPRDETKAGAPPFLIQGSTSAQLYKLGTLEVHPDADSVVIYVYGDNRPGFRMMSTRWGVPAILGIGSPDFRDFLWGLVNVPVALVQAFVPRLDLFHDLWSTLYTHRFSGGKEGVVLNAVEKEIARDPRVSFVVQTGDLVENGARGLLWNDFVKNHARLRQTVPYLATPGNHERTHHPIGRQNWNAVMGPPAQLDRYWFAVDFPESLARFVFLDTNVMVDTKNHYPDSLENVISNEQIAWLDSALAVPARYRFLVMHYPLVSSGHYLSDWKYDDSRPIETRRRARILEICRRRGVTAVFGGHEHLYQRTFIRGRDGRGFWHVATGGAGAPLYRISDSQRRAAINVVLPDSSHVTWNKAHSVYHFSRLTMARPRRGRERILLDVFQVQPNGKVKPIDHVDLTKLPSLENRPATSVQAQP